MNCKKTALCLLLLFSPNQTVTMEECIRNHPIATVIGTLFFGSILGYSIAKVDISLPNIPIENLTPDLNGAINTTTSLASNLTNTITHIVQPFNDNLDALYSLVDKENTKQGSIFSFPENSSKKERALFIACTNGYTQCVRMLLEDTTININIVAQIRLDFCNHIEATPLSQACRNNHAEIVKLLLQDPEIIVYRCNALKYACAHGLNDIALLLLNHISQNPDDTYIHRPYCINSFLMPTNMSQDDEYLSKPLSAACENEQMHTITMLLNHPKIKKTFIALIKACKKGNIEIITTLINDKNKQFFPQKDTKSIDINDECRYIKNDAQGIYREMLCAAATTPNAKKLLPILFQQKTITLLFNTNTISIKWKNLFTTFERYNISFDNNKYTQKLITHIINCKHINTLYTKNLPLEYASKKSINWINGLIDAGIDYTQEIPTFVLLSYANKTITNLNQLNFFKKLNNEEKNNFIQQQIYYAIECIDNISSFRYTLYNQPFIIDDFITKLLPNADLNKRNEHGKIPLDLAYEQYTKPESKSETMLVYHAFLRQTPTISPYELYYRLAAQQDMIKDVTKVIMQHYHLLTFKRNAEKDYVLKLTRDDINKHKYELDNLQKNINKYIDQQYEQLTNTIHNNININKTL